MVETTAMPYAADRQARVAAHEHHPDAACAAPAAKRSRARRRPAAMRGRWDDQPPARAFDQRTGVQVAGRRASGHWNPPRERRPLRHVGNEQRARPAGTARSARSSTRTPAMRIEVVIDFRQLLTGPE
jgi:hypothetical protein